MAKAIRQAAIGRAVPSEALVRDHDPLGLVVPLPHQDGSGLEPVTRRMMAPRLEFVSVKGAGASGKPGAVYYA